MIKKISLTHRRDFVDGLKASLSIIFGYWALSIACGALGPLNGLTISQTLFLNFFFYSASAEFVFCALFGAHAGALEIATTIGLVNIRYLLIASYVAQFFKKSALWQKIITNIFITDESFSVASQYAKKHNNQIPFAWWSGIHFSCVVNWNIAGIIGAFIGSLIPPWASAALGFSLVGMFVGLLMLTLQGSTYKIFDCLVIFSAVIITLFLNGHINKNLLILIVAILSAAIAATARAIYLNKRKTEAEPSLINENPADING